MKQSTKNLGFPDDFVNLELKFYVYSDEVDGLRKN